MPRSHVVPFTPATNPEDAARVTGLRYTTDARPGIRRDRRGKAFRYVNAGGKVVRAAAELQRVRSLVTPPAWTSVWICTDPRGHLQATGRDARGRKQYRCARRGNSSRLRAMRLGHRGEEEHRQGRRDGCREA